MLRETGIGAAARPPASDTRTASKAGTETAPTLHVDLGAVRANYEETRRRFGGGLVAAVLKSNAYGMGSEPVAAALWSAGCRDFWINDLEEAAPLRKLLPNASLYCLMGLGGHHISDFEAIGAIPALASLAEVEHCARHAARGGRRIAIALQVDTGLGRLGLGFEDVEFLAATPMLLQGLDIRCYVSHLAAYNLPGDPANDVQRQLMLRCASLLPAAPVSLAASSGVFMTRDWHFDMARVGSALFGIQTSVLHQPGLRPCYALTAPLLAVTEYPAGRRLGYRGATVLGRRSRIATAAIGYANGLPQGFAEKGMARIGGHAVPLVGGIAMNMTMLDITDLPQDLQLAGVRATFLDAEQPIEGIADRLGCAPNVLLTQLGAGTRKVYANA